MRQEREEEEVEEEEEEVTLLEGVLMLDLNLSTTVTNNQANKKANIDDNKTDMKNINLKASSDIDDADNIDDSQDNEQDNDITEINDDNDGNDDNDNNEENDENEENEENEEDDDDYDINELERPCGAASPTHDRKSDKTKWCPEEDNILRDAVSLNKGKKWRAISTRLPGKTEVQCLHRWSKVLHPDLKKGPWTDEVNILILL